jgi:hypothetical protein
MDQVQRDRRAFDLAHQYIHALAVPGIDAALINEYLRPDATKQKPNDIRELYFRLLFHAQNANMKSRVIGGSIGGVEKLSEVLFEFDPCQVLAEYQSWDQLLERVEQVLKPRGQVRRTGRSLWPLYCQCTLSAASFMSQFSTGDDFHRWIRFFDEDPRSRPALPLLIEKEVFGFGFALACDFLKELGYLNFSKPDTHIKDLFEALGLANTRNDFEVFRSVARVAAVVGESPFCVDKLFWLIGSGNFYNHPNLGKMGRIGSRKSDFIEYASAALTEAKL